MDRDGVFHATDRPLTVVVAGAGLMGSQIGVEYALGGHRVVFVARHPELARERVAKALDLAESLELAPAATVADARERIEIAPSLTAAGPQADLIVESIVEDAEEKIVLLRQAAELFPGAILASNTSSIPISGMGHATGAGARLIGTHYWNPPLLMPLVEVIAGDETDPAVIAFACETLRSLGKRPMRIDKDVDGFVWNRLQNALLREAVHLAESGVAAPEVIDEIVRDGLARRWTLTGPFETAALGGLATFERVSAYILPALSRAERLERLERFTYHSDETLADVRARRDLGLLDALKRDRAKADEASDD